MQASPTAGASCFPMPQLVQSSAVGPEQVAQLASHAVQLAAPAVPKKPLAQAQIEAVHTWCGSVQSAAMVQPPPTRALRLTPIACEEDDEDEDDDGPDDDGDDPQAASVSSASSASTDDERRSRPPLPVAGTTASGHAFTAPASAVHSAPLAQPADWLQNRLEIRQQAMRRTRILLSEAMIALWAKSHL